MAFCNNLLGKAAAGPSHRQEVVGSSCKFCFPRGVSEHVPFEDALSVFLQALKTFGLTILTDFYSEFT